MCRPCSRSPRGDPLHSTASPPARRPTKSRSGQGSGSWSRMRLRVDDGDVLASYVHAADVADGIRRAACAGRSGAHYVLGGENLSFRAFLDLVGEVSGVRRRVVALPRAAALVAGYAALLWGRLGGDVAITPGWVRVFLEHRPADVEPARSDLGYAPRSARAGVAETVVWLRGGGGSWPWPLAG